MKQLLALLLLLQCCCFCTAQSNNKQLHFNHLSIENGLPEDLIRSLIQDKYGYIWMATQNGLVRYDGYKTKVYSLSPNISQSVYTLFEDRKGTLWIGSLFGGLYQYDRSGDSLVHYTPSKAAAYSNSDGVVTMHDDKLGMLWMIMWSWDRNEGYIQFFNPAIKRFSYYGNKGKGKHYINSTDFNKVFEDRKGTIWMSSVNNGIYAYNPKEDRFIAHFATDDSLQQKSFNCIEEDSANPGMLWLSVQNKNAKRQELWQYNTAANTVETFSHDARNSLSLGGDTLFIIKKDSKGRIWIGTNKGLSLFNPVNKSFINYSPLDGKSSPVAEITEDRDGNLWCNTVNSIGYGLLYFNTGSGEFTRYSTGISASYNYFSNLMTDRAGTLWFAGYYNGAYWINKGLSKVSVYNSGNIHYFPAGTIRGFAEAPKANVYIGSEKGLYRWRPGTDSFQLMPFNQGMFIKPLLADSKGQVWCSVDNGLLCYEPSTGKTKLYAYDAKDSTSLSNNNVRCVFEDHTGVLWVGTFGSGLCRFNSQTQNFTRYPYIINNNNTPNKNALDDDQVESIYEDKNGVLWVGTNNGGLNELNRQTGHFTTYQNQLPGFNCVTNIFEDSKNRLWAGTYMAGLFLFDRQTKTSKKYSEKDGLLYDGNWSILDDRHNNLWTFSPRGISIINPALDTFRSFGNNEFLPGRQLNAYTALKTKEGSFLVACSDSGFISINPDDFIPDTNTPVVHIESLSFTSSNSGNNAKDSSLVTFGRNNIQLHYNQNRISFEYVGLQYQNAEQTKYAYKLDGYDKDWIQAGTQRTITYTNLSPGSYTFHVKAANSDGVWSAGDESIVFSIMPPWWQTWWAYLLYAIVFVASVWAFIAYRSRQLKQSNKILEHKVQVRTAEVMEQKEELTAQKEELAAQRDHLETALVDLQSTQAQLIQSEKMASLGELTAGIAHEIQNPLNFVNNFSEVNREMIDEATEEIDKGNIQEVKNILSDIKDNSEKINHHGKRADAIVKNMLQHSRQTKSIKEPTNINALCDEYLRLSYHGLRAKDKSFNADFKTDLDNSIEKINIIPQDIGRVLLNLYNNAFYAVNEKYTAHRSPLTDDYKPLVLIQTKKINDKVEIIVSDNGNGIPQNIVDKIFQPFFTTKPTGQGTGLGLSLSYDIIKAHGGEIKVESKKGEGSEFIINLPI